MSVSYGGDSITFGDGSIVASGSQGFKNKVINGHMMIDQRNAGASVTPTSNVFGPDRWTPQLAQSSKFSYRQMESANTSASNYESSSAPTGFTNSLKITSSSNYTEIENSNPANNIRKKSSYLLSKKYKISNSK